MKKAPTEADGRRALRDHVIDRALEARARYGAAVDLVSFLAMLDDREVVRFPTTLVFSEAALQPGEIAHAEPRGEHPGEGFTLFVHPRFEGRDDVVPLVAAYQIVRINYGDIATHEEAELFGATLYGLEVEEYYQTLCALADELAGGGPCTG